jgi:hypothetical protein
VLKQTMSKAWGTPGNKDSKQRITQAISELCGESG